VVKIEVPERVRTFVWMMRHGKILANKMKHAMNLCEPYCNRCNLHEETIIRVVRDCHIDMVVWIHLVPQQISNNFFSLQKHNGLIII
jgi:hypothetical protein